MNRPTNVTRRRRPAVPPSHKGMGSLGQARRRPAVSVRYTPWARQEETRMSEPRALFRSEAIAFHRRGQSGAVVPLQPVSAKLLFWSIVATFALIVGYLAVAQY